LRDEGSGSVIYRPYPHALSKRLFRSNFPSDLRWYILDPLGERQYNY